MGERKEGPPDFTSQRALFRHTAGFSLPHLLLHAANRRELCLAGEPITADSSAALPLELQALRFAREGLEPSCLQRRTCGITFYVGALPYARVDSARTGGPRLAGDARGTLPQPLDLRGIYLGIVYAEQLAVDMDLPIGHLEISGNFRPPRLIPYRFGPMLARGASCLPDKGLRKPGVGFSRSRVDDLPARARAHASPLKDLRKPLTEIRPARGFSAVCEPQ